MKNTFAVFTDFVSSFRLSEPADRSGYEKVVLSDHTWLDSGTGVIKVVPAVWFRPDERLSPQSLKIKVDKWLLHLGIAADDEITGITICFLAIFSEDGHSLLEALELLESTIFETDVQHCQVMPTLAGDGWHGVLEWDGFEFGRLDAQKLVYRCRKAQAIVHEKTVGSLDGAPAFWSPVFKRRVMDVGRLFWKLKSPAIKTFGGIVLESHLQRMALLHVREMWVALEDAFLLPFALSFPFIDIASLRSATGVETWTCYSGIGRDGAQSWIDRGICLPSQRMPKDFSQLQSFLDGTSQRYRLNLLAASNLYQLLVQVSRSIARSNTHLLSSRSDESFLFLIIALEQVFSETENTTKSITRRTALIVHRALDLSFDEAEKLVKRLYDRRSRLLHDGLGDVDNSDLLSAIDLASPTMRCLVFLCAQAESQNAGYHEKWLKKLDYTLAGIEAGIFPTDDHLIEMGILDSRKT